jgi:hypothetical protein
MAFDPVTAPGLAAQLFRPGTPQALALVRAAWPAAVGAELARRTVVQALVGGTLHVRVPDAAWRKTLHRMRRDVLARLREIAGDLAPHTLGFLEGAEANSAPPATRGGAPALPHPPTQSAEAHSAPLRAAAERIADPEIRSRFLETAARYLARAASPRLDGTSSSGALDGGPDHA